jgi:hypothetical protein
VSPSSFRLTDAENFVYTQPSFSWLEPRLPPISLEPGQKTQGWIMFEVNAATPMEVLRYGESEVFRATH